MNPLTTDIAGDRYHWANGRGRLRALTVLLGALLAAGLGCNGSCGSERSPARLPETRGEGSALLLTTSLASPTTDGGERQPPHVRRDEHGYAATPPQRNDPVVAWVNERPVHRSALELRLQRRLAVGSDRSRQRDATWRNRERRRIVRELVQDEMLRECIAEEGIEVSDEELQEHLVREIEQVFHSETHFERYLRRRNLTRDAYTEDRRFGLQLAQLLASRGPMETSEDEVRDYYQRYRENWRAPERVLVSTITLRLSRTAEADAFAEAHDQLMSLRETAQANLDAFEQLARDRSQSPNRYQGGDLGWVYRDDPDLEEGVAAVLFGIDAGQISEPVRTRRGLQIYWVRDHRPEGTRDFDEVQRSLYDVVAQRREQSRRLALTAELESRYEVGYNEEAWGLEAE